jgi:hypothetical protein
MAYIVRSHKTGRVKPPTQINSPQARLALSLDVRGYDILTAYALSSFESETKGKVLTANLGLLGKMSGAAAIVTSNFDLLHNGRVFLDTRLKALGILGTYCRVPIVSRIFSLT